MIQQLELAELPLRLIGTGVRSMMVVFFLFAMITFLVNNTYWIAYDLMLPDVRMPFSADELGEAYYAIGTDFHKATVNLRKDDESRMTHTFYSYDPLAKAAKTAGLDVCWLDFSKVPADSELGKACSSYMYMGSLGEGYSPLMLVLPMTYRVYQCPSIWYDSLILVSEATPISPKPAW